ncbi:Uncharacterized protein APZ42_004412 [Daphnia magna]|uniref:Cc8L18.2-like protein n=1 Tax=Daphnia magna TaxID=35525 RepID=A0A164H2V0_9CRUS|nr:Uncharacterized protein APZ42_004412 [Daphnia magna]
MQCSDFLAKEAISLRNEVGILPKIKSKLSGKRLSDSDLSTIIQFYEENSKTSPGMKDVIMINSIKELYIRLKEEHPAIKIGQSKFFSLRPRWCVTSKATNTLNVCVCIYHQNPKLMLAALNPSLKYRDMFSMIVCSLDDENCIYYQDNPNLRCRNCTDPSVLSEFLRSQLTGDEVTYSEWISENGQTVMKKTIDTADDFVEKLSSKLQQLCRHHFVSHKQGKFFNNLKENLKEDECLILLDFAENYSLMIQDEVQSHH